MLGEPHVLNAETLRQMVEMNAEASSNTCIHGCTQGLIPLQDKLGNGTAFR